MNKPVADTVREEKAAHKLGMFAGVFTPSILTILGIILFLRMGYTTGQAGLLQALGLVALATSVSFITTASLSAIATNIQVKGGGAYFLISRTLGVQFGGAIGLVLFLAQSVSIAFYCIGFAEALVAVLPENQWITGPTIAAASVLFLFVLAWLGADLATKFQYVVMVLLFFALVSFFYGAALKWDSALLMRNILPEENHLSFWALFAIFFPAVTGFTQGVNMSGDLKDPGWAIPIGTFFAVGLSTVIYFATVICFSATMPNAALMGDYNAMEKIARMPFLIHAGVISATLSSAMASFLGAPRIMQSIAKDKIFTVLNPFAKGAGPSDNPRRGVLLSLVIALGTIALGQLNMVAQVVSMFFLISYALINYATFYEARTASTSFRPRFRWFRPWLGLLGFILCAGAILAIDITSGVMALFILMAIYQYLRQKKGIARWADSRRSFYLQQVKENLRLAAQEPEHDRDWRPVILAFTNDTERLANQLKFANWLEGRAGMTAAVRIIHGKGLKIKGEQENLRQQLVSHIRETRVHAYPLVVSVADMSKALPVIVQSYGIGPIRPNTALVNWMDEVGKGIGGIGASNYARNLRISFRQGLNLVVLKADDLRWEKIEQTDPKERCIDIWWNNDATSRLMLLLAYLMTRRETWAKAKLRVLACSEEKCGGNEKGQLRKLMDDFRIDAEPVTVPDQQGSTVVEMSGKSSLVFIPCRIREDKVLDIQGESLLKVLPYLPVTAMVMAAQDIDLEAEPDTGLQGELAQAEDEFNQAKKRYEALLKTSEKFHEKAQKLSDRLQNSANHNGEFDQMIKQADQAIEQEDKAFRKAAKAKAKADDAARNYENLLKTTGSDEDPV